MNTHPSFGALATSFLSSLFLLPYASHDHRHLNILFLPKLPVIFRALSPNPFATAWSQSSLPVTAFTLSGTPYLPFSWFTACCPQTHPQVSHFHFLSPLPPFSLSHCRILAVSLLKTSWTVLIPLNHKGLCSEHLMLFFDCLQLITKSLAKPKGRMVLIDST